jgi:hypothetical protein
MLKVNRVMINIRNLEKIYFKTWKALETTVKEMDSWLV